MKRLHVRFLTSGLRVDEHSYNEQFYDDYSTNINSSDTFNMHAKLST